MLFYEDTGDIGYQHFICTELTKSINSDTNESL